MYILRSKIKNRKENKEYYIYRFVESKRAGKKVRQHTILNIGANFSLPKEQWQILCSRIKDIIGGQKNLFQVTEKIEQLAQYYAERIIQSKIDTLKESKSDFHNADINSIQLENPRSISCEYVALEAFRFLGLDKKLKELKFTKPQIAAAMGIVIDRMCNSGKEFSTQQWLQNKSGLGELINHDFKKTSLYKISQVSDLLLKNKNSLETFLFHRQQNLFEAKEGIILFIPVRMNSKERKLYDSPAASGSHETEKCSCLSAADSLVLDGRGFPVKSVSFEEHQYASVENVIHSLREDLSSGKPVVLLDAETIEKKGAEWLDTSLYSYIAVNMKQYREFSEEHAQAVIKEDTGMLKIEKVVDSGSGETLLCCHSALLKNREHVMEKSINDSFVKAISKLEQGLYKKRCIKKYEVVTERIERIKTKFPKAAEKYKIKIKKDKKTGNAVRISWSPVSSSGRENSVPEEYLMLTNYTTFSKAELWNFYAMLDDIEPLLLNFRSDSDLKPENHRSSDLRSQHSFITLLAYHIARTICYQLKQPGLNISWRILKKELSGQNRITISMKDKSGDIVYIRKSTHPEPAQQKIYRMLGLPVYPGRTIKKTE